MKRKFYNPLTMWGTYVGTLFGLILFGLDYLATGLDDLGLSEPRISFLIIPILLGYGIHSLMRKLK